VKIVNPRMFEEPVEDAGDANILADLRHARPQAANPPDQEIDTDTCT